MLRTRPVVTVWTGREWEVILWKWALQIGVHLERRWTLPGDLRAIDGLVQNESLAHPSGSSEQCGETADRRRDVGGGRVGGASGAGAWGQRQPGVRLAEAVSGRAVGRAAARIKLLPVSVSEILCAPPMELSCQQSALPRALPGTIHIKLGQAQVRIEGSADPALLRVLLECLRG